QLHEVPVVVKELDDVQALEIALIENLQRSDLNILEEAQGYQRLMGEFGHTQEKLATVIGKSRSHIANTMRLLALPPSVQTLVRQGKLTAGHARALITAKNPEELAKIVLNQNLSVRETEKLVAGEGGGGGRKSKPGKSSSSGSVAKDVNTLALEKEVSEKLGLKVSVDVAGHADGEIPYGAVRIEFKNLDQLDYVMRKLSSR
ncbi:MAG TPA: ParB/RepB/Spo0J family partition protein, partial [Patescibacteria group bacterium]|nr:ParB/RepB/Spo0J family partition protein [Patescibacteria group bacterium]